MRRSRFTHFAAIDWSGAAGERQRGIAVALCSKGDATPLLVRPGHRWSRAEVLAWLGEELPAATLVGCDLSTSLPYADRGAFFPGWDDSPPDARTLWALVDRICQNDPHLAASSFTEHAQASRYFRRHGGRLGDRFGTGAGRMRRTEEAQRALGCRPYSNFNLVGAAQVGKSGLTGMRMLHRLAGRIAIWPFDPLPQTGPVLVEIYSTIAAMAAGRSASRSKIRTVAELHTALAALGCTGRPGMEQVDDHQADALITAAWLRRAAQDPRLWSPPALTPQLARTEGWTFGAV